MFPGFPAELLDCSENLLELHNLLKIVLISKTVSRSSFLIPGWLTSEIKLRLRNTLQPQGVQCNRPWRIQASPITISKWCSAVNPPKNASHSNRWKQFSATYLLCQVGERGFWITSTAKYCKCHLADLENITFTDRLCWETVVGSVVHTEEWVSQPAACHGCEFSLKWIQLPPSLVH